MKFTKRNNGRRFAGKCLLSLASLALTAVVSETAARLFWREESDGGSCSIPDPVLVNRFRANCRQAVKLPEGERVAFQFNECGYRDPRPCTDPQPETLRIFAIGDSFTLGAMTPYDRTYVHVAERTLAQKLPHPVEFMNGGVYGWDLPQYQVWLDEALRRKPRIVTVGLLPNDLFPDISREGIEKRRHLLQTEPAERVFSQIVSEGRPWPERAVRDVMSRSRALHLLGHLLLSSDALYSASYRKGRGEDSYLRKEYSPVWTSKIEDAGLILSDMAARAQSHGAQLVVILIPQRIQALLLRHQTDFPELDSYAFSRHIGDVCRGWGIPVIDFLEHLAITDKPTSAYFPIDGHLTPEGQERLGRFVAEQMLGRGIVR